MAPDGQLSLTLGGFAAAQHIALGFQILPWLEASFRYSRLVHFSNGKTDYDRSFGLKLRLFQETRFTPDVSIGIRDLLGTGIYSAEYVAASKTIGDFDFTAGLGWGRLASNATFPNPFGLILKSFDIRQTAVGQGGTISFGQFFHGPNMGLFGGAIWHTPISNLNLSVEYSSDRYVRETAVGSFRPKWPVNIGLTYQPMAGVSVTGGWFYGDTVGGIISIALDPTQPAAPLKIDPAPMPVTLRSDVDRARAVSVLVEKSTREDPRAISRPWVKVGASTINSQQSFVAELKNSMRQTENVEIYGQTLLVDVHASGAGANYCKTYARLATVSQTELDSVALTDLDDPRGRIALCAVDGGAKEGHVVPISEVSGDDQGLAGQMTAPDDVPHPEHKDDLSTIEKQIRADADAQSLKIEAISIGESDLTVYYANTRYEFEDAALGRLVRILMADAPSDIEVFRLIPMVFGQPTQDVRILRAPLERMILARGAPSEIGQAIGLRASPMDVPLLAENQDRTYPRFGWSISPELREGFFDPTSPIRIQIYASAAGDIEIIPGLTLEGAFEGNIYDDFSAKVPSNSVLPHVRTDVAKYLTIGRNGISALDTAYRSRIAPGVFVEAKIGYLEDMFAGAGGQVLWRPEGERWALGADLYQVWQRNFDRLFGLQHYNVLTGHISVYYKSPWYGLNFNVHAGRYLAGDYGATFEVTRRFATGIEVGAYATLTNVPFAKFGEGSFDKGIIVHIPLEWGLPFSTQSEYGLNLNSLTRDGGQRLEGDDSLYDETRRTSYDELVAHVDGIVNP